MSGRPVQSSPRVQVVLVVVGGVGVVWGIIMSYDGRQLMNAALWATIIIPHCTSHQRPRDWLRFFNVQFSFWRFENVLKKRKKRKMKKKSETNLDPTQ